MRRSGRSPAARRGSLARYRNLLDALAQRYVDAGASGGRNLPAYVREVLKLYAEFVELEPQTSVRFADFMYRFLRAAKLDPSLGGAALETERVAR